MTDLGQDYLEARAILEGRSGMLPTLAHLRAMQLYHEDTMIWIAMHLGTLHEKVMNK
jgi:hypothetical protein